MSIRPCNQGNAVNSNSMMNLIQRRAGYSMFAILVCLILLPGAKTQAQNKGTVTIHSDPRMAVLLRKNRTFAPPPAEPPPPPPIKVTDPKPLPPPAMPPPVATGAITVAPHREGKQVYAGKGYRVQIYNGADRNKAVAAKTEFMRHYPGVHTYMIYSQPNFKVKVGDYRNRSDAEGMLRDANAMYTSPCMIVPDDVIVNAN